MATLDLKCSAMLKGVYSFKAVNALTGEERHLGEVSETPNMIVKSGLNAVSGSATLTHQCCVGTSATTVSFLDTELGNQVAATTTVQSSSEGGSPTEPFYRWHRKVFRFPQGAAAGNLTEVGMKTSTGVLLSRALIADSSGAPTILTILSDEYLDITYELRTYIDVKDKTQTLEVNGEKYTVTLRAADAGSSGSNQTGISSSGSQILRSGFIGAPTSSPSGSSFSQNRSVVGSYIQDSYERTFRTSAGLNDANFGGGIQSLYIQTTQGNFQAGFVPAIPKNNYMIFTVDMTIGWGEYSI